MTKPDIMKKIIFFLLIVASTQAIAQPYQSIFGKDSTSWAFEFYNLPGKLMEVAKISKDTLISDTVYKIVDLSTMRGFMREDTITGKVWYRGENFFADPNPRYELWANEVLIFDYSLEPGDSFDVSNHQYMDTSHRYSKVDSVKYINGRKYIYFDMADVNWVNSGITEQYVMVEGSGGNMSPLWKCHLYETFNVYFTQYLLCYYKDGIKTGYENGRYAGECSPTMGIGESDLNKGDISIYPNPATNNVFLTFKGKEQRVNIAMYDVVGKLISREDAIMIGDYPYQIAMGNLASGVYIVSVQDKQGAFYKFKVVKQ
jgi:hypothetical protein